MRFKKTVSRAFSSAFDPLSLSPKIWLKSPIAGLNNGDAVTLWPDSSGNGHAFTITNATYETNSQNGQSSVVTTGGANTGTGSALAWTLGEYSLYAVTKQQFDYSSGMGIMQIGSGQAVSLSGYSGTDFGLAYGTNPSVNYVSVNPPSGTITAFHVVNIRVPSSGTGIKAGLNGTDGSPVSIPGPDTPNTGTHAPAIWQTIGTAFWGKSADFFFFNYALNTTQHNNLITYLRTKWGI
jgi:hypothetical protein